MIYVVLFSCINLTLLPRIYSNLSFKFRTVTESNSKSVIATSDRYKVQSLPTTTTKTNKPSTLNNLSTPKRGIAARSTNKGLNATSKSYGRGTYFTLFLQNKNKNINKKA